MTEPTFLTVRGPCASCDHDHPGGRCGFNIGPFGAGRLGEGDDLPTPRMVIYEDGTTRVYPCGCREHARRIRRCFVCHPVPPDIPKIDGVRDFHAHMTCADHSAYRFCEKCGTLTEGCEIVEHDEFDELVCRVCREAGGA